MSTIRQKKLAKAIIANATSNDPLNKQELVVSSGYSPISAESSAHLIIEAKGVKDELKKYGFDEESAKNVVTDILNDKQVDQNIRLNAAKEVFKVYGTYAAEKTFNLTATASVDELKEVIQNDLAKFRSN